MPQKSVAIEKLLGQARNPTSGQVDKGLIPYRIFNLVPDRLGGYVPFGARSAVNRADGLHLQLTNVARTIGADAAGVSSFLTPSNYNLQLYRGATVADRFQTVSFTSSGLKYLPAVVHMDSAGAYVTRANFFVFDQTHPDRDEATDPDGSYRIAVEPIVNGAASATAVAGSSYGTGNMPEAFKYVAFGAGDFFGVSNRKIYKRTGLGAWTELFSDTSGSYGNFKGIFYGGSTWMAIQDKTSGGNSRVLYSTDTGATWTSVDFAAGFSVLTLVYTSTAWIAGGYSGGFASEVQKVYVSEDGGATWAKGRNFSAGLVYAGVSWKPSQAVMMGYVTSGWGDPSVTPNDGDFWESWEAYIMPPLVVAGSPGLVKLRPNAQFAVTSETKVVVAHSFGSVTRFNQADVDSFTQGAMEMLPGVSVGGSSTVIAGMVYDPVGAIVLMCGYNVDSSNAITPRAWRSTNEGQTWERMTDVESAVTGKFIGVAVDELGNAVFFTETTEVNIATRAGLEGGSYNVFLMSYFNTHAGRFVYDLRSLKMTTDDGARIEFSAPEQNEILGSNPWMLVNPLYTPIAEDLRWDAYIQKGSDVVLGEEIQYTIRYAFTKPFPTAAKPLEDVTLDALPLGRQLLTDGRPTTAIFEKSLTALHNGRMWGMASQDEDLWTAQGDDISLEIANQAQRFVLCYTEIGWANLMSDRSFIPLQPSQSNYLTGLLSTPSGLLVMFENEIFLITGDPAYGNVSVELYLDMVGNDVGSRPCKVGGVPFCVWNGKVWALQAGQATLIGADQWLASDPFVLVSPEPQTRSILALTKSGQVFRYILDDQFWLTDAVTSDTISISDMFPNCTCITGQNTRFVDEDGYLWATTSDHDAAPDTPHVVYKMIDFGVPERRTSLYLAKIGVEGPIFVKEYDRDAGSFNAADLPGLFYKSANATNGNTWETVNPQIPGVSPYKVGVNTSRKAGTLAWRLPLAKTKGNSIDLRFELRGFTYEDTMKMPLSLFFSQGGALR